ncbi:MAG TPA: hypothetical protein VGD77_02735 [Gemmatimonadaceae bacterium]
MKRRAALLWFALAAGWGCTSGPVFPGDRLPPGAWGGEHALLMVSDTAATLEFDCASGRIGGPLPVDGDGRFTWEGEYIVGHGGPIRQDEPPDARPATYDGSTNGRDMTLRVRVKDGSIPPLEFQLERGRDARVFKCL